MESTPLSRRDVLRGIGGVVAAGVAGIGAGGSGKSVPAADRAADPIVDAHVHIVSSRLSRVYTNGPAPASYDGPLPPGGNAALAETAAAELKAANVEHALCMPSAVVSDQDPLGIQPTLIQAALIKGPKLHAIGIAHPERFDRDHLDNVEAALKKGKVKALKAYLGYLHYDALNPGYRPYYRLAGKYNIPIIFHTGDTNSPQAKVRLAHPLQVDELAVDFPDTKFVLAHFGNPWVMDAAQVVYKNKNVWAELSAFLIGTVAEFAAMERSGVVDRALKRIHEGIEYAESPDRFIFGSDWPLSPIATYRDFVSRLFHKTEVDGVLSGNAKRLFKL